MSEIHEACKRGDLNRVSSIVTTGRGAEVRSVDDTGHTPLHRAAESYDANCVKIIELLVASGASADVKSRDGCTPLMRAASRHALTAASALIKAGADTNAKDDKGQTAIMHAVCHFEVEGIMDQVRKEERGLGEPHYWEMVTLLLGAKANPNAKDNEGRSQLIHSVIFDQVDAVTALLKGGADPNGKDKKDWTPLMWAATAQGSGMAEILLGAGADASIKDEKGRTALFISIAQDNPGPVRALMNHQPHDAREREKILFDAIGWSSPGVVELLLGEEEVNVNVKNKFGETPLEAALGTVISGRGDAFLGVLRTVLAHGANPNQLNRFGYGDSVLDNALEWMIRDQGKEVEPPKGEAMGILLEYGADPSFKGSHGSTPLHNAAGNTSHDMREVIEKLLKGGADVNARNDAGRTPLYVAEDEGNFGHAKVIRKHGGKGGMPFWVTLVKRMRSAKGRRP